MSTARLGLANSIAGIMVALSAPVLGSIADSGGLKKRFLMFFAYLGVVMTSALYMVSKGNWPLAVFLYVMANIGFSGGNIFYDSLITAIAPEEKMDSVSALGFSLGYLGGGILFALNVCMSLYPESFGFSDMEILETMLNWDNYITRLISAQDIERPALINEMSIERAKMVISLDAPNNFMADGDLSEWDHIVPLHFDGDNNLFTGSIDGSEDLSVDCYMAMDNDYLYVAFDVIDDFYTWAEDNTQNWWDDESIEFFIGLYEFKSHHQFFQRGEQPDYRLLFLPDTLWILFLNRALNPKEENQNIRLHLYLQDFYRI